MLHKMKIYLYGLSPQLIQTPYAKFVLVIKRYPLTDFKLFAGHIVTNRDLDADKKTPVSQYLMMRDLNANCLDSYGAVQELKRAIDFALYCLL